MLEEMTELMNIEIGDVTTNITSAKYIIFLRNLCYRGVELMIDEEQGRGTEEGRPTFIPRDYMFARDRQKLQRIGIEFDHRLVGGVSS